MKLYHGSNIAVQNPQILESDRKLDFGTGFYLTSNLEQAERWAKLTQARRENGTATVSVFEADEKILNTLNVLHFQKADKSWLEFVTQNRKNVAQQNDSYDVVIGPVANDRTMPVISLYFSGIYDADETVKRLLPQKLNDQYTFKTEKSLTALNFIEAKTHDK
ncbi:DUF3990 domain-containing protein [Treponema sp. UBA6852]|uniref:DUF3990 domain-containing protein n=1 Tax=Treponema sp. UBA6852 TaxID=1947744 RepID=UPI0025EC0A6E|nr:DUF3990 domain-containing protein [Treponema sp. UBA6852]